METHGKVLVVFISVCFRGHIGMAEIKTLS